MVNHETILLFCTIDEFLLLLISNPNPKVHMLNDKTTSVHEVSKNNIIPWIVTHLRQKQRKCVFQICFTWIYGLIFGSNSEYNLLRFVVHCVVDFSA